MEVSGVCTTGAATVGAGAGTGSGPGGWVAGDAEAGRVIGGTCSDGACSDGDTAVLEGSGEGASIGAPQEGQGPFTPAREAGTRSRTPQLGQVNEILSWLMGVSLREADGEARQSHRDGQFPNASSRVICREHGSLGQGARGGL